MTADEVGAYRPTCGDPEFQGYDGEGVHLPVRVPVPERREVEARLIEGMGRS